MALIDCVECGKKISDKAVSCPGCGCPVEKKQKCEECGMLFSLNLDTCPDCGCPVENFVIEKNNKDPKPFKPSKDFKPSKTYPIYNDSFGIIECAEKSEGTKVLMNCSTSVSREFLDITNEFTGARIYTKNDNLMSIGLENCISNFVNKGQSNHEIEQSKNFIEKYRETKKTDIYIFPSFKFSLDNDKNAIHVCSTALFNSEFDIGGFKADDLKKVYEILDQTVRCSGWNAKIQKYYGLDITFFGLNCTHCVNEEGDLFLSGLYYDLKGESNTELKDNFICFKNNCYFVRIYKKDIEKILIRKEIPNNVQDGYKLVVSFILVDGDDISFELKEIVASYADKLLNKLYDKYGELIATKKTFFETDEYLMSLHPEIYHRNNEKKNVEVTTSWSPGVEIYDTDYNCYKTSDIDSYELLDAKKSGVSAVGRAAVGAAVLGPVGLLAGVTAKKKYKVLLKFKNGIKKTVTLSEKDLNLLVENV